MLCWGVTMFALPAAAQRLPSLADQIAQVTHSLPESSQTVIARLDSFSRLPPGEWRFHAGDVPHGEEVNLDDHGWPVATRGTHAGFDAIWYRRWIEVPKNFNGYDLTGARIWFRFQAYANGPTPQIIYFNGRRVALGDDLEPVVLFDKARPTDKVLVAVKLLRTVDEKTFIGADLKNRLRRRASQPGGSAPGIPVRRSPRAQSFQRCAG